MIQATPKCTALRDELLHSLLSSYLKEHEHSKERALLTRLYTVSPAFVRSWLIGLHTAVCVVVRSIWSVLLTLCCVCTTQDPMQVSSVYQIANELKEVSVAGGSPSLLSQLLDARPFSFCIDLAAYQFTQRRSNTASAVAFATNELESVLRARLLAHGPAFADACVQYLERHASQSGVRPHSGVRLLNADAISVFARALKPAPAPAPVPASASLSVVEQQKPVDLTSQPLKVKSAPGGNDGGSAGSGGGKQSEGSSGGSGGNGGSAAGSGGSGGGGGGASRYELLYLVSLRCKF